MVLSSWQSHCESSPGSFDECRTVQSGRRPKTKPDDLDCESACEGCQKLHSPSPFIIITQPESWYLFYRPTEGRRLSRPSWLVTYRDALHIHRRSPILVLTRSDVVQLRFRGQLNFTNIALELKLPFWKVNKDKMESSKNTTEAKVLVLLILCYVKSLICQSRQQLYQSMDNKL